MPPYPTLLVNPCIRFFYRYDSMDKEWSAPHSGEIEFSGVDVFFRIRSGKSIHMVFSLAVSSERNPVPVCLPETDETPAFCRIVFRSCRMALFPKEIINSVNSNFIRMFYAKLEKIKPSVLFSFPQECYFFMNIRSLYRSSSFWS